MTSSILSNKKGLIGLIGIIIFIVSSCIIPYFTDYNPDNIDLEYSSIPPSLKHFLGTDKLGRDVLMRILFGLRISLLLAFSSSIVGLFIGLLVGSSCGLLKGKWDFIMMKVIDFFNSIPLIFFIIILSMILNRDTSYLIIGLGLITWPNLTKIIRDKVFEISSNEYIYAAKSLGETNWGIVFKHILPNLKGTIYLNFTISIPTIIMNETFLSFLGLGVRPPNSSIGNLLSHSINHISLHPYMAFAPIGALISVLLFFHIFVEGLKDSLK